MSTNSIVDYFRQYFPSINFEALSTIQSNLNKFHCQPIDFNEIEFVHRSNLVNCGEEELSTSSLILNNRYNTLEKLIHTDEQCEHRPHQRYPPLNEHELEEELRQFCKNIDSNDIKIVLGSSFNVPITSKPIDNNVFVVPSE